MSEVRSSTTAAGGGAFASAARGIDRRRIADDLAGVIVQAGGIAIIVSILAILIFIVAQAWPLVRGAAVTHSSSGDSYTALALASDPYKTHVAGIDAAGVIRVHRTGDTGDEVVARSVAGAVESAFADADGGFLGVVDETGSIVLSPLEWRLGFRDGARTVAPEILEPIVFAIPDLRLEGPVHAVRSADSESLALVAASSGGDVVMFRRTREVNDFTGEVATTEESSSVAAPADLVALALDSELHNVYGATAGGLLYRWPAHPDLRAEPEIVDAGGEVTALALLLGGRSLVVGMRDGGLAVWFSAPDATGEVALRRVREFPPHSTAIRHIVPSRRDKGFVAVDDLGEVGIYHSTSERLLWRGSSGMRAIDAVAFTPKADGLILNGERRQSVIDVDNPHPDVSLWSLFAPVWYEGYEGPDLVWQSSSGTDDFEPKYSLTPLLIGTLKGTFYSLLIAIPLAVLGAMYVSHFTHPRLRNVIKPTVEIMAALPSVVLGFLAGLWLAPRVEESFSSLVLMVLAFPFVVIATGLVWERIPVGWRNRMPFGSEVFAFSLTLAVTGFACVALSDAFEIAVFGGDFQAWLLRVSGLQYDQRNAIVVGLAMGFAVIPIVFAISEDAFSNVPSNLVSGSLALGANRWQTVTRVVLPTASPGIFSAVMVGFGRAVGETMIVLMATGNTPIQDWNPFNGFRTLSANIAVEIPEAPHFGTLYRVLFLAALLLFVVTFAINTIAELVRQGLRERYARL